MALCSTHRQEADKWINSTAPTTGVQIATVGNLPGQRPGAAWIETIRSQVSLIRKSCEQRQGCTGS